VEMKCKECDDENAVHSTENFLQLSCFISTEVKYLQLGLRSRLQEHLTKRSPNLDRDALYEKKSLISRIPAYLAVQMVRFQFKEKDKVNAKILKDVKFPAQLDVFELCTPELQKKLTPMREKFQDIEERKIEAARQQVKKRAVESTEVVKHHQFWFEDDLGSNNSGYYELQAVLTHKGRSSSSGHYVAWVRKSGDHWIQCNDDDITPVSLEDIMKLSGGGDWHCAYVLLYGPRQLEVEDLSKGDPMETSEESAVSAVQE